MIYILANPQAGSAKSALDTITGLCRSSGIPFRLRLTSCPGHTGEIVSSLDLTSDDILAVLGGDGFLNEVVNSFLPDRPCPCPILLYPAGTGNDFVRGIRMDRSPAAVASLLREAGSCPVHVHDIPIVEYERAVLSGPRPAGSDAEGSTSDSHTTGRSFNVSCGLGMDAAVCRDLDRSTLKRMLNRIKLGKLSYILLGIRQLFLTSKKKRTSLRLILDNHSEYRLNDLAFISFHNLPYEGGGFPFAPNADASDGRIDICAVTVPSRLCLIPLLLVCLLGGHHVLFRSWVHMYRCSQAELFSERPLPLHTDGEVPCDVRHMKITLSAFHLHLLYAVRQD